MKKLTKEKVEYEDAGDRFRKIGNKRARQINKYANLINGMLPQPSYDISPEDAQKLLDYLTTAVDPLFTNLQKIIDGAPLRGKREIQDVF